MKSDKDILTSLPLISILKWKNHILRFSNLHKSECQFNRFMIIKKKWKEKSKPFHRHLQSKFLSIWFPAYKISSIRTAYYTHTLTHVQTIMERWNTHIQIGAYIYIPVSISSVLSTHTLHVSKIWHDSRIACVCVRVSTHWTVNIHTYWNLVDRQHLIDSVVCTTCIFYMEI